MILLEKNLRDQGCPEIIIKYVIKRAPYICYSHRDLESVHNVDVLCTWSEQKEGTSFWSSIHNNRFETALKIAKTKNLLKHINPYD